ncbi:MAG: hypothetical protein H9W82_15835 [Lactobacillus sp.]|nr:hypothetical protein [Lactobacillus sp.]
MIHIYTGNEKSSELAISWFLLQGIEVKICKKSQLTREMIEEICMVFPFRIDDLFSRRSRIFKDIEPFFEQYTFEKKVDLLVHERKLLRTPIIFSKNKLLIGFNKEEIRLFIPRKKRKEAYAQLYVKEVVNYLEKQKTFDSKRVSN